MPREVQGSEDYLDLDRLRGTPEYERNMMDLIEVIFLKRRWRFNEEDEDKYMLVNTVDKFRIFCRDHTLDDGSKIDPEEVIKQAEEKYKKGEDLYIPEALPPKDPGTLKSEADALIEKLRAKNLLNPAIEKKMQDFADRTQGERQLKIPKKPIKPS
jgi:hypothetical protein